jgi:hypothetical protein
MRTAPRGQGAAALDVAELGRRGGVEERISGALGPVSAEKKRNGGAGLEARPVGREGSGAVGALGVDKARGRRRRAAGARGKTGEEEKLLTGRVRLLYW